LRGEQTLRPESVRFFKNPLAEHSGGLDTTSYDVRDGHVIEGVLRTDDPELWFPVISGVPSFLTGPLGGDLTAFAARHQLPYCRGNKLDSGASTQAKTNETFSDKWRRFKRYGIEPNHQDFLFGWYCKKLGVSDREALQQFYSVRKRVLEVGPGSGFNTRFIAEHCPGEVFALDISDAAFTTFENTRHLPNCTVVQADLMDAPFADSYFDLIVADGVLHHTPNTQAALAALYRKLAPGGQFFFYVYRKMGTARQFCDAHIREHFTKLSPEACYEACEALTDLGRELSRLNATITLENPIPVLGIPAGTHNVQRLVYYSFVKCFWNDAFDYETNNMVNFDWYHPHDAWQHSEEEVASWLSELGVRHYHFNDANPNGISCLLTKPAD
jgi:SAM-dependent methyltransferase